MVWSLYDVKRFHFRTWIFKPSDGRSQVDVARIIDDGDAEILTSLYDVAVEKPATLVLKNVNLTYNGTYEFSLVAGGSSSVVIYIAGKLLFMCKLDFFTP